jgi:hypothetical protein
VVNGVLVGNGSGRRGVRRGAGSIRDANSSVRRVDGSRGSGDSSRVAKLDVVGEGVAGSSVAVGGVGGSVVR